MISQQKIKECVELYLKYVEEITPEVHVREKEGYKFKSVDNFQKHFDLEIKELSKMLGQAIVQNNLVAGINYLPRRSIIRFANESEKEIRQFFEILYDETRDVGERFKEAQDVIDHLQEMRNHELNKTFHSYIGLRFLSLLLAFRYPNKYNAIKPREWRHFCLYVDPEFSIPKKSSPGLQYQIFTEHIEALRHYIKELPEMNELRKKFTAGLNFQDDEFRWMTQDVIYMGARAMDQESETVTMPSEALHTSKEEIDEEDEYGQPTEKDRFTFEKDLESYIVDNWRSIDFGEKLEIFIDSAGEIAQQFPTDLGPIDILARDNNGNFVVIELKRDLVTEKVVGQMAKYMQWVEDNLAKKDGKSVRGLILAYRSNKAVNDAIRALRFPVSIIYYSLKLNLLDSGGSDNK